VRDRLRVRISPLTKLVNLIQKNCENDSAMSMAMAMVTELSL
jgi:hypothetical protein